jgi:hypothetical protein
MLSPRKKWMFYSVVVVVFVVAVAASVVVVPTVPYSTNESVGVACYYDCDNKRRREVTNG